MASALNPEEEEKSVTLLVKKIHRDISYLFV